MEFAGELWLAILVGTFALWMLSFVAWAVSPHHFGDFGKLPDEEAVMGELKQADVKPGNYMFPQGMSH